MLLPASVLVVKTADRNLEQRCRPPNNTKKDQGIGGCLGLRVGAIGECGLMGRGFTLDCGEHFKTRWRQWLHKNATESCT